MRTAALRAATAVAGLGLAFGAALAIGAPASAAPAQSVTRCGGCCWGNQWGNNWGGANWGNNWGGHHGNWGNQGWPNFNDNDNDNDNTNTNVNVLDVNGLTGGDHGGNYRGNGDNGLLATLGGLV